MAAVDEERIFQIRRNLSDAGCDPQWIQRFLELERERRREEQYRLLSQHRASLLEALHGEQYRIDCLDYLIYTMRKEDEAGDAERASRKDGRFTGEQ